MPSSYKLALALLMLSLSYSCAAGKKDKNKNTGNGNSNGNSNGKSNKEIVAPTATEVDPAPVEPAPSKKNGKKQTDDTATEVDPAPVAPASSKSNGKKKTDVTATEVNPAPVAPDPSKGNGKKQTDVTVKSNNGNGNGNGNSNAKNGHDHKDRVKIVKDRVKIVKGKFKEQRQAAQDRAAVKKAERLILKEKAFDPEIGAGVDPEILDTEDLAGEEELAYLEQVAEMYATTDMEHASIVPPGRKAKVGKVEGAYDGNSAGGVGLNGRGYIKNMLEGRFDLGGDLTDMGKGITNKMAAQGRQKKEGAYNGNENIVDDSEQVEYRGMADPETGLVDEESDPTVVFGGKPPASFGASDYVRPAADGSAPYVVALGSGDTLTPQDFERICTGVLVGPDTVLTTAECALHGTAGGIGGVLTTSESMITKAHVGRRSLTESDPSGETYQSVNVRARFVHPKYNPEDVQNGGQGHNLALLVLERLVEERFLDPNKTGKPTLLLNREPDDPYYGQAIYTAGWGANVDGTPEYGDLQEAELSYVSRKDCATDSGLQGGVPENTLCITKVDADCVGDTGGPVVLRKSTKESKPGIATTYDQFGTPMTTMTNGDEYSCDTLVGIVAHGYGCQHEDSAVPATYVRVSAQVDWIAATACQFSAKPPAELMCHQYGDPTKASYYGAEAKVEEPHTVLDEQGKYVVESDTGKAEGPSDEEYDGGPEVVLDDMGKYITDLGEAGKMEGAANEDVQEFVVSHEEPEYETFNEDYLLRDDGEDGDSLASDSDGEDGDSLVSDSDGATASDVEQHDLSADGFAPKTSNADPIDAPDFQGYACQDAAALLLDDKVRVVSCPEWIDADLDHAADKCERYSRFCPVACGKCDPPPQTAEEETLEGQVALDDGEGGVEVVSEKKAKLRKKHSLRGNAYGQYKFENEMGAGKLRGKTSKHEKNKDKNNAASGDKGVEKKPKGQANGH